LEELGQEYQFDLVDLAKGGHKSEAYLALNPGGKVPAMRDDDLLMTESGAIVTYLADKFPQAGLIPPAGTKQRGSYEQWAYFALCELEQGLWNIGKHSFVYPEEKRVKGMKETGAMEFQVALALLSEGLGDKTYILGDEFSMADVLLGHTLLWADAFKQPIEQPNVQAYYQRVCARPALAAAKAREKAALEV
jgi:glutathione S-transferase